MDLIADLQYFSAADALQWAASRRFDGQILFRRNKRSLTFSFAEGCIVQCESNHRLEWFAQHLFAQGLVDAMDLAAARQPDHKDRLGATLIGLGILDRETVRHALMDHTLDLACSVIGWEDGIVAAKSSSLRPLADPDPEPLEALFVTLEATRRLDELARIRLAVPHENVELLAGPAEPEDSLTPPRRRLLEQFTSGQTLGALYAEVGGCRFSFESNLARVIEESLIQIGSLGVAPPSSAENMLTLVDVLLDNDLERRLRA
jgi:hypothetical protein